MKRKPPDELKCILEILTTLTVIDGSCELLWLGEVISVSLCRSLPIFAHGSCYPQFFMSKRR